VTIRRSRSCWSIVALLGTILLFARPAAAESDDTSFQKREYHSGAGAGMPYRLFVPPSYNAQNKYPLVLWLHGAAGRGNDNILQISEGNTLGTHVWTKPENQTKFPAFVLAPQCPAEKFWAYPRDEQMPEQLRLALEILDTVEKEFSIDADRVYVAGQSMGGEGTWAALRYAPHRFAAALPLCGYLTPEETAKLPRIPVWVFQGEDDPIVPLAHARAFVAALKKAGGEVKYQEYPGLKHQVWEKAFVEPGLVDWLSAKKRKR